MINSGKRCNAKLKKAFIINLVAVVIALLYYAVLGFLDITCPIKALLGFPCPVCGSTTAILRLLKGDVAGYFSTQPFSLPILIAVALLINRFLFKKPFTVIIDVYAIAVAVANFIYYLIYLF